MQFIFRLTAVAALLAAVTSPVRAQEAAPAPGASEPSAEAPAKPAPSAAPDEPAKKSELQALAEELRRLKLEIGISDVEYRSFAGMGPAASKVYFAPKGLSLGGYGEAYYRNQLGATGSELCKTSATACDFSDILRVVLYTGYRFSDRIVFNAEIEYEHQRQVFVEFAYLDFLLTKALQLRIGNVLVPVGFTNELHEPVFFHGVERPEVERNLIPSTWNENGVGLHGEVLPGLTYKLYGLAGLNVARRPSAGNWIRGLRTRGGTTDTGAGDRALAETFAGAVALAYERGPVAVGASAYYGRAGQGQAVQPLPQSGTQTRPQDLRTIDADVSLVEAHARFTWRGATLKALAVQGTFGDADLVNEKHQLTGTAGIGSRVRGGYVEGAYDVLSLRGGEAQLLPFVRYERLRLHDQVPAGWERNPANDVQLLVTGLTYKPIPTVALKGDFTWRRTEVEENPVQRAVNVAAAFVF
ncbi:MAG TPA: hypothetical protein VEB43_16245 [Anaeromyxobacter sp.]|nr:hypothetical protein [Anaeromyxobacter sp.]